MTSNDLYSQITMGSTGSTGKRQHDSELNYEQQLESERDVKQPSKNAWFIDDDGEVLVHGGSTVSWKVGMVR